MAVNSVKAGCPPATGRLTRVDTEIDIYRAPHAVFAYVTTPARWHLWHPATVEVRGVPDRPLVAGETALELIAFAGRKAEVLWTVQACNAPHRWEIVADTDEGAARIVYRIDPTDGGSFFQRTLEFRSKRWPWRSLDSTLTRWLLERQSARALRNLKEVLER
jgi:hypothetical protein